MTFLIICMICLSCTSQKITVYHYDNSKYDGYEIMCDGMKAFFNKNDPDIRIYHEYSSMLNNEMKQVKEKITFSKTEDRDCDGYLYYAFVSKKDTLYSDYGLRYWRYKNKGVVYQLNEAVKNEIKHIIGKPTSSNSQKL